MFAAALLVPRSEFVVTVEVWRVPKMRVERVHVVTHSLYTRGNAHTHTRARLRAGTYARTRAHTHTHTHTHTHVSVMLTRVILFI